MLRGNIAGTWGSWGSAQDAVDQGRDKIILQSGDAPASDLPDVPLVYDFVDETEDPGRARAILDAWERLQAVGRPVAAPPGTNAELVAFLSEAFEKALNDPELVEQSERTRRPLHHVDAPEMSRIVQESMVMEPEIRDLFIRAIKGEI
jgi:hypothetical protein